MADEYSVVEDAIATLLKTLSGQFDKPSKQVSQGDDSILSLGFPRFAILRPGKYSENASDFGVDTIEMLWGTELYIYSRYKSEILTTADMRAFRSDVLALFRNYPTLNNTKGVIRNIETSSSEGLGYVRTKGMPEGAIAFMAQKIDIMTPQIITRSGGEF
jgi:hypothetical protein